MPGPFNSACTGSWARCSDRAQALRGSSLALNLRMHTPPIEAHVGGALVKIVAITVDLALRRSARVAVLVAEAATALTILLARLPVGLAQVGRSFTDAQRCQRASYKGCSHQLERLTSRERPASQSASQLIEVAIGSFLAHLVPLSPKGGTLGD
jgi:hypothetical protein